VHVAAASVMSQHRWSELLEHVLAIEISILFHTTFLVCGKSLNNPLTFDRCCEGYSIFL
jgi:hypothetical protein